MTSSAPDIVLSSDGWAVRLARDIPAVLEARSPLGHVLLGDVPGVLPVLQIAAVEREVVWTGKPLTPEARVECVLLESSATHAAYRVKGVLYEELAAEVTLRYELCGPSLSTSWGDVVEYPGFLLLQVRPPLLASAEISQTGARLVVGVDGGRIVDPRLVNNFREIESHPSQTFPLLSAMVYHDDLLAVVKLNSIEDHLRMAVAPRHRVTAIGHLIAYGTRLRGGDAFWAWRNLRVDLPEQPVAATLGVTFRHRPPPANQNHPQLFRPDLSFVVQSGSSVTTRFVERNGSEPLSWIDGAKLLRPTDAMRPGPGFADGLMYNMQITLAGDERWFEYTPTGFTFDNALDQVRKIHHLTDGQLQRPRVYGWQHRGHDTGYPNTLEVNQAAGGEAALERFIRESKKLNALVYFHDNYIDAYRHSSDFCEADVARDETGELRRNWWWDGGAGYIHSSVRYARDKAATRLAANLRRYPYFNRDNIYIDIINDNLDRYDFTRGAPASRTDDFNAKSAIVRLHQQAGYAVESECFMEVFVGVLDHQQGIRADGYWSRNLFDGESEIPLASYLFHGYDSFGYSSPLNPDDDLGIGRDLLRSLRFGCDCEKDDIGVRTPISAAVDCFYVLSLICLRLRRRRITHVKIDGSRWLVEYEAAGDCENRLGNGPTDVECDVQSRQYRVRLDGKVVGQSFSTFLPGPRPRTWLAYSRYGGESRWTLPLEWDDQSHFKAVTLTETGPGVLVEIHRQASDLIMNLPPKTPVRVWTE